jgi:glycosyltransferase involved in cell wall biosynthesis
MMKILRVVTNYYSAKAHLSPILDMYRANDKIIVVGNNVAKLSRNHPHVRFINIPIARSVSIIRDFICLIWIVRIVLVEKPDVIHTIMTKAGLLGGMAGFICGVKVRLHTFTGQVWAALPRTSFRRILLRRVEWAICKLCTACLTDSPSQSEFLWNEGILKNSLKIPHLGVGSLNGVDISDARAKALQKPANTVIPNNQTYFVCTYLSRKSLDKGCVEFLKIAKLLADKSDKYAFLYIGPTEYDYTRTREWKSLELSKERFIVHEFVDNHFFYLKQSHLLIAPSFREGFGSVVIEAAALGIPAIGYNIYGLADAIDDGKSGFLAPVGDYKAVADLAEKMHVDTKLYQEVSAYAEKRVVQSFNRDVIFSEYQNYLG